MTKPNILKKNAIENPKIKPRQCYTPEQLAEYWQLNKSVVMKDIRNGKLQAAKIGRQYRILGSDALIFKSKR